MGEILSAWAPVMVLIAALAGSYVTRRNAKDTSALGQWSTLAAELRSELTEAKQSNRDTLARVETLEEEERRKAALARIHQRWDEMIISWVRRTDPDAHIPDPPPLD